MDEKNTNTRPNVRRGNFPPKLYLANFAEKSVVRDVSIRCAIKNLKKITDRNVAEDNMESKSESQET